MKLSEIFGTLKIRPDRDAEITGVTCSTDKIIPGCIFAAIRGTNTDGHRFLRLAAERGAAAAIVDREVDFPPGLEIVKCENAETAYAEAAAAFYGHPENELVTVGVTGTNGKTTVSNMVKAIINTAGIGCGLIGTIETVAGGISRPAERTTPSAEELFALLREMADSGDRCCVMEVSSHALARNRVHGINFDVGVVTNVTRDHLDFHKTMEAYAEAKAGLMSMSKTAVVNLDDPWADRFMYRAGKTFTYAIDREADFRARNVECTPDKVSFSSPVGEIELPPGGRFSVYNALAAMAAASAIGVDNKYIRSGLGLFPGVRGRLELLKTKGPYKIYIDYAHTPDGLENVLAALRQFTRGRLITVFGCGGDRDKTKRPMMGEISARLSDFSVVTNDNPRTEIPSAIIADVLRGIGNAPFAAIPDRREAIRLAMDMAKEGDVILLAGKGHETYQVVGTENLHMDEREIVTELEEHK